MASTSETGHIINIENYKLVIDRCVGFGTDYQPANEALIIVNMTGQWTDVKAAHDTYLDKLEDTKQPVDDREDMFDELRSRTTRVNNIYGSTKATARMKKDAAGLVKKILGSNVKIPRLEGGVPDPKYVSNSQQSFVKKIDNFRQLVLLLAGDGNYAPNETIFKIVTLETFLEDLEAKNLSVEETLGKAIHFRQLRDHGLYDLEIGVIDTVLMCKKYVKGLYGATSDEAKSVTGIKFRRVMKLKPVVS